MEQYRKSVTEAEMLQALADFVQAERGFFWHVRDARGQTLEHLADCIITLPQRPYAPGQVAFLELKTQRDSIRPGQREALRMIEQAHEVIAGIVRPVPKALDEYTLDEALELLGKRA